MKLLDGNGILSEGIRSLIENTNDLMFVKNREYVYIASSQSYATNCVRVNGIEDVIGKTDFELFEDQSIAQKYRDDDEALFESGKVMAEFQEEYPNLDGSKHQCITTKIVLRDSNGNPAAILGQYHDIDSQIEEEISRRRDINKNVALALSNSFFAANYADLQTHEFVNIRSMDYARDIVAHCRTNEEAFEAFIQALVRPEYQSKVREFCNSETIAERLEGKLEIDCEYLSKVATGWCRASFYPCEWDENGTVTHVLFAVSPIDESVAGEIESGIENKKNVDAILEVAPAGIAVYEWNGNDLRFLNTNQYYRDMLGCEELHAGDAPAYSMVHPDDLDGYLSAIRNALSGSSKLEYALRIWDTRVKAYRWYQINAVSRPGEDGTALVYSIFSDITMRMDLIKNYRDRLHTIEAINQDAMCMCDINLTRNKFANVQAEAIIKQIGEEASTVDEFINMAAEGVFDPDEQKEYKRIFSRQNMLDSFARGESHIAYRHFYKAAPTRTEIVETVYDLVKEPVTGDIVGICYAKDVGNLVVSDILLNAALNDAYPMAAVVHVETGEYYLYEAERNEYGTHRQNFWQDVYNRLADSVSGLELDDIRDNMSPGKITDYLKSHNDFSYAFDGLYRETRCRLEANFRYVDDKHHLLLGTLRNITDETLYKQYKYDSEHCRLTGLYNRDTTFRKCREYLNEYPDTKCIMMHLNVRHFHLYNTFFGESGGDNLLCSIAEILNRFGEKYDFYVAGRFEADVFCVFFPEVMEHFEADVRYSFQELERFSPNFPLDLAIGAYWVEDRTMSIEGMFSRAIIAAKSHKKNLFGLISRYDEPMEKELRYTQQITSEMTAGIEQEQFEVYLQPKYALRSDKLVGAEALVRWIHPERGLIPPGKFIPAFEKNGFIANLDRYMWEHVCQILHDWQKSGKPMYPVSVNISRVSMYSHQTVPFLVYLVDKYAIDPKYLELELTETAYMDDPEDLKRMLRELQSHGFKILMDDFGSGYSSLNTLRDLPVDVLKLDMKFLSETEGDSRGMAVLSSVVRMSKMLNLPIVAEGVEREEQADYLRSIGCEYVQGYLYAKPMPAREYEKLVCQGDDEVLAGEPAEENEISEGATFAKADVAVDDPFKSIGVLEYDQERFAYLRTNKKFLKEFNLIENLKPASRVFREHMDDRSYNILIKTFANCAETRRDSLCFLKWESDDGTLRKYQGYVHYNGRIGVYADLVVTFINVTDVDRFGDEE